MENNDNDLPIAQNPSFYRELLAVSSGTWASLTGITDYEVLSRLEKDIAAFYLYHQDRPYESWMDVWKAYRRAVLTLRAEDLEPEPATETPAWVN